MRPEPRKADSWRPSEHHAHHKSSSEKFQRRLHARILASVAEYETEVRAERVAAGQAVARRNGKKWGGTKKGWRWKVRDDQQAAILELDGAGKPITQIARITGLSRPTVYRVLQRAASLDTRTGIQGLFTCA
jgi:DNA invertase Pin-like site-specific DNA recombinase